VEFSIKQSSPEKQISTTKLRNGCILVGVYEEGKLTDAAQALNKLSQHYISDIIARGDMTGKAASTLLLHNVPNIGTERVLLLGLGKRAELDARQYRDCVRAAMRSLLSTNSKEAQLYLTELPVKERDSAWCISQAVLAAYESAYRFDRLKSKAEKPKQSLAKIQFTLLTGKPTAALQTSLNQAVAIAQGMVLTKDLGNLPGNICTPSYLAQQAVSLAKTHKTIKTTVLEEKDMKKLGMGSLLSVTQGSAEPAKLITLEYHGADKKQKPVVLVGKGITFDSGGISLKPGAEMDEMKYDMCGAASVLGTILAIAEMGLKLNVVGIIPSSDNMPSGTASKPGDIVTSMSGQTIEILNTDAEGRLVLCDALTYAARFTPDTVIDIATLTGACIIALGHVASGLFSNEDKLAHELLAAGEQTQDKAWHMPLWDEYQTQLDSNFADMQNIGGRAGGSITAACFLSRYTKAYRWAHLDIAGTAWKSGKDKGATGRPVPLLTQYLINHAARNK
jgi:leucyl aminopeptidase